jgi:uncharacterized lipoprotein YajG
MAQSHLCAVPQPPVLSGDPPNMKRITLAASLLALAACSGGEKAPEAAPAAAAPAAAAPAPAMDSTMKMDSAAKAAPAAAAPAAAAPAADAKKDAKKP